MGRGNRGEREKFITWETQGLFQKEPYIKAQIDLNRARMEPGNEKEDNRDVQNSNK